MEDLIKQVIEKDGLNSRERYSPLIHRRMYMYTIMRKHGMNFQKIGSFFNRNHATIIHGIQRYKDLTKSNDAMLKVDTEEYEQIFGKIPVPKKTYNLEKDVRKATTMADLDIIKRRLNNNLYEI
tara:strand:- start:57 stop:428 length:372 start_codon:yes stop_codon:yes gene_type:complete